MCMQDNVSRCNITALASPPDDAPEMKWLLWRPQKHLTAIVQDAQAPLSNPQDNLAPLSNSQDNLHAKGAMAEPHPCTFMTHTRQC